MERMREHVIELIVDELTEQMSLQENWNPENSVNGRPSVDMNGLSRCPMQRVIQREVTNSGANQQLVSNFDPP